MMKSISQFDESQITLNIGVISDAHIKQPPEEENCDKLREALRQLSARSSSGVLDLLLAVGDMCNDGTAVQMERLRRVLSEQLDFSRTPMLYAFGNHERHNADCLATKGQIFADCAHGEPQHVAAGRQHITVGGYHFLSVDAAVFNRTEGIHYSPETIAWLDAELASLTAAEPERYVFIQTHALVWDTVYGTTRTPFYQSEDLAGLLCRYPQAVIFGGHLHYPLNDERCIMQKGFTAMETASVSYMLIDGKDFVDTGYTSRLPDRTAFSQGLLLQIDHAGALRVTRLDFHRKAVIKERWILPAPTANGAHLQVYTPARGDDDHHMPPILTGEPRFETVQTEEGKRLCVIFPAAVAQDMVRDYTILLHADDVSSNAPLRFRFFSDFYRCPQIADMAKSCRYLLPPVAPGCYRVEIYAGDSWGGRSESICGTAVL